jgi:tagatose 6-phosphate kinase
MILVFDPNPALERVALVEEFVSGETRKPMRVSTHAGGAGLRAAHAARQHGADVLALGFVGGHLGSLLRECLDRQDIPHVLTPIAADTRGDFLLLDRERGVVTEVPEQAPAFDASEAERLLAALERHLPHAALLILADAQPEGGDRDLFARAFAAARRAEVPVWADLRGEAMEAAIAGGAWLLRTNLKNFQRRTERSLQYDSAILAEARGIVAGGVGHVCVTLGEDGMLLINAEGAWRIAPPVVSHYNPTGSGETLVGAASARYEREPDLLAALRYGCAAAAASVAHDAPGQAAPGEVLALLPRTTIERIA